MSGVVEYERQQPELHLVDLFAVEEETTFLDDFRRLILSIESSSVPTSLTSKRQAKFHTTAFHILQNVGPWGVFRFIELEFFRKKQQLQLLNFHPNDTYIQMQLTNAERVIALCQMKRAHLNIALNQGLSAKMIKLKHLVMQQENSVEQGEIELFLTVKSLIYVSNRCECRIVFELFEELYKGQNDNKVACAVGKSTNMDAAGFLIPKACKSFDSFFDEPSIKILVTSLTGNKMTVPNMYDANIILKVVAIDLQEGEKNIFTWYKNLVSKTNGVFLNLKAKQPQPQQDTFSKLELQQLNKGRVDTISELLFEDASDLVDLNSSISKLNTICQLLSQRCKKIPIQPKYSYEEQINTLTNRLEFRAMLTIPNHIESTIVTPFCKSKRHSKKLAAAIALLQFYEQDLLDENLNKHQAKKKRKTEEFNTWISASTFTSEPKAFYI